MRRHKTKITDRLDLYTIARCPLCGATDSVFAGPGLVCRAHPGHPLGPAPRPLEDDRGLSMTPSGPPTA